MGSYVGEIGTNGSKTTGTTLAVTATPSPQPAVGDLIVVSCGRDDISSDPLTGDSISDGHGNTYTRLTVPGNNGADGTGANGCNGVVFFCTLTTAWSGSTTVTWTHPSVDARGMIVQHFAPASGYVFGQYGTPATGSNSTGNPAALTTGNLVPDGDLVFGAAVLELDASTSVTADSDTTAGSWSSLSTKAGTTGGVGNTNILVYTQHKFPTTLGNQTWNTTTGVAGDTGDTLITFHEAAATGISFVGMGAQVASSTGSVTPPLPPGTATNDLLLMVIAGRPSSNASDGISIASGSDGWAQHGATSFREVGAVDLSVQVWWKIHDGSESDPSVSANTVLADVGATDRGFSAQIAAFRGMDTSTPFDVTPVASDNAAAATWTPTGVSTATNNAMALSAVATADDNALNFNTSQNFQLIFALGDYDTTTGSDHAVGLAFKVITSAGSVTQPTWNQSAAGNDAWAGIATALKPAGGGSTVNGVAASDFTFTGPAVGSVDHPGQAVSDFTFAGPAVGTRTTFGTADSTFTFAAPAVGTRTTAGTAASDFVFSGAAVGTREVAGQAVSTFTFAGPASGTVTHLGTAVSDFVFSAPAVGAVVLTGVAETALVFSAPAVGTVVHLGVATSDFTFAGPAVGSVTHPGQAVSDFAFSAPAVGSVSVSGAAETVLVFDGSAAGTVTVFGVAATVLVFDAPAVGLAEHPALVTEATSERRPGSTTSELRPDSTTSERRPLATTSERRRSVPV